MKAYKGFTLRNMLVYFRNRQTVFFSLLSPIIVFVLYVMFLKGNYVDSINRSMGSLSTLIEAEDIDSLVNGLLLSGIIGSSIITVPFGTLGIIVEDRETRKDRDILATPVKRSEIILGYFTASALCALAVTLVLLTVGILILQELGTMYWSAADLASLYGLTILGTLSSTAVSMAVMLFFRSSSACGAFLGILSAAAGFVIGAYIPVSQFSEAVQTFCSLWPASGICTLIRGSLMNGVLEHMNTGIGGIDQGEFVRTIHNVFGFEQKIASKAMSTSAILLYVTIVTAACILINAAVYAKIYRKK